VHAFFKKFVEFDKGANDYTHTSVAYKYGLC
jgi:hypothetical protein